MTLNDLRDRCALDPTLRSAWHELIAAARQARPAITTYSFIRYAKGVPTQKQEEAVSLSRSDFDQAMERFVELCASQNVTVPAEEFSIDDICSMGSV